MTKKENVGLIKYAGILSGSGARKLRKTIAEHRSDFNKDSKERVGRIVKPVIK